MQDKNQAYKFFADYIYKKTGIFYPEKDYYRLDSRLNTLCKAYNCPDYLALYTLYVTNMNPLMERDLINLATNNETFFFRDKKPFEFLTNEVFKKAVESKMGYLDIWSCACSSGQEPLSILMEYLEKGYAQHFKIKLTATDISSEILNKAKSGLYSTLEVQRGLPIQLLIKYFDKHSENAWKAKDLIHKDIDYKFFNIITDIYPQKKYDVIFCRNVLIYQEKENKQKIVDQLFQALKPNGYLIFGAGESLIGYQHQFQQKLINGCMVFQKADVATIKVA